jgi:D-alanyl-D-alanine carboxypeptidase
MNPDSNPNTDANPQANSDANPRFAYLGSPREFSQDEVVGNHTPEISPADKAAAAAMVAKRPSSSFKLVKTDTLATGIMAHLKWGLVMGIIIAIILVSVAASVTQGILLVHDRFVGDGTVEKNNSNQGGLAAASSTDQNRALGSDDGAPSTVALLNFVPMYKVANPDLLASVTATAKGYYVADIKTGERIMEKNSSEMFPIASVSKLMTAIIAHENMDPQKVVVVSRDSYNAYGAQGELVPGERIKLGDLMYPLLMESSNDGAEVIAESYGRPEFITLMNKKAAELGMHDTYYEDPSGLDARNKSTAEDQFKLLKYIKEKAPFLLDMTRVRQFAILKHTWFNKNRFLNSEMFIGGKNGYIDESLWTTASLFEVTLARGGKRQIGIVELYSRDREGDAFKLINFLQKNVSYTETGSF